MPDVRGQREPETTQNKMANCINYDCDDALGLHLLNDCGEEVQGGVKHMIILECNHTITDPSNATEVQDNLDALTATIVKNVKIGVPAASPIMVASNVACSTDKLVSYDRTLSIVDGNVNDNNVDFYNNLLNGQSKGGIIIYECGSGKVTWIDDEVKFTGSRIIPESDNEFQRFEITSMWRNKYEPNIYEAPAGIFD